MAAAAQLEAGADGRGAQRAAVSVGKLFGRGQVVTMGEHFGVRLTQISGSAQD